MLHFIDTKVHFYLPFTGLFAKDFGLRDQIRRASVSVMLNIAEVFILLLQPFDICSCGKIKKDIDNV